MKEKLRETVVRKHASVVLTLFLLLLIAGCGDSNNPNSAITTGQTATQQGGQQAGALATGTQIVTRPVQTPFFQSYSSGAGTGVHVSHNSVPCKTCHLTGGAVQFDPTSQAIISGTLRTDSTGKVIVNPDGTVAKNNVLIASQLPSYNPNDGTCANIACHWVKPGVYNYYNDADQQNEQASYGTALPRTSPDWYSIPGSALCSACHGYPPYDAPNQYVWHSGWHGGVNVGNGTDVIGFNYCQTCHPDVMSTVKNGVLITTINPVSKNGSLHGNGVVDVSPNWGLGVWCGYCHGG